MTLTSVDETFLDLVEPLRGELTAHCYRMLGSVHDAEDLVQETYLRAWRAYHNFENRSSLRTWMYSIATNVCLTALQSKHRRTLPTGIGQPSGGPTGPLEERPEIPWLEPLPDSVVWGRNADDPAAEIVTRESVRLAFVAALQHLTPQQRAVLILRDVLAWHASEVAETLQTSVAAVNSSLQRARAHLAKVDLETPALSGDPRTAELLDAYVEAFESYDVDRIVSLLTADAVWEMPPFVAWYRGREAIAQLITNYCPASGPEDQRMIRTSANGQPAFGLYMRGPDGVHRPFQLQQLVIADGQVAAVTCYFDTSLFEVFGLPPTAPA
jgi:RNA polymerase sigma-70 factor, ECF subfamily